MHKQVQNLHYNVYFIDKWLKFQCVQVNELTLNKRLDMPTLSLCTYIIYPLVLWITDETIRKDDDMYHHRLVSFAEQNLNLYAGSYTVFSIKQAMINLFKLKYGVGGVEPH